MRTSLYQWIYSSTAFIPPCLLGTFLSASGLNTILWPFVVTGQAIAGVARQKVITHKQSDFISPVFQQLPSIESSVLENVDELYEKIHKKALLKLDELYQKQIIISEEAIKQANKLLSDETLRVQELFDSLEEALQSIESYAQRLSEFC